MKEIKQNCENEAFNHNNRRLERYLRCVGNISLICRKQVVTDYCGTLQGVGTVSERGFLYGAFEVVSRSSEGRAASSVRRQTEGSPTKVRNIPSSLADFRR